MNAAAEMVGQALGAANRIVPTLRLVLRSINLIFLGAWCNLWDLAPPLYVGLV